jgi:hypothetical protein
MRVSVERVCVIGWKAFVFVAGAGLEYDPAN